MDSFLFPDTTVLINFAIIDHLAALRARLGDRGRACEAVVAEIGWMAASVPKLADVDCGEWFGDAIRIDDPIDVRAVNLMRTAKFGGAQAEPLKHLGESQTIHVVGTFEEYKSSVIITDDRSAYEFAQKRGLITRHTVDLLKDMVAFGEVPAAEALAWAREMDGNGRTLLEMPTSVADLQ